MHTVFIVSTLILSFTKASDDNNEATLAEEKPFDFDNITSNDDYGDEKYIIHKHCLPPLRHVLEKLKQKYNKKSHEELVHNVLNARKYYAFIAKNSVGIIQCSETRLGAIGCYIFDFYISVKALPTLDHIVTSKETFVSLIDMFSFSLHVDHNKIKYMKDL